MSNRSAADESADRWVLDQRTGARVGGDDPADGLRLHGCGRLVTRDIVFVTNWFTELVARAAAR